MHLPMKSVFSYIVLTMIERFPFSKNILESRSIYSLVIFSYNTSETAFLFAAFGEVDDMAVLRVKREEEFAPVKNSDDVGVDCPKTARELYKKLHNM